jgi:hypothetical protein
MAPVFILQIRKGALNVPKGCKITSSSFNTVLRRLVAWIRLSLLLKIQW